jgi:hypothetical protein
LTLPAILGSSLASDVKDVYMVIQKNEGMIEQERAKALIRMDRNRFSCGTKKKTLYNQH